MCTQGSFLPTSLGRAMRSATARYQSSTKLPSFSSCTSLPSTRVHFFHCGTRARRSMGVALGASIQRVVPSGKLLTCCGTLVRTAQTTGSVCSLPSSTPWNWAPLFGVSCCSLTKLPRTVCTKRRCERTVMPVLAT
jgi:hypothetical protein